MLVQDAPPLAVPSEALRQRRNQRVLVAFDGSPGAWAALAQGIEVAEAEGAALAIATVVAPHSYAWGAFAPAAAYQARAARQRLDTIERQQLLAAARDEVPAAVPVTTHVLHGTPAQTLTAFATHGGFDLVCCGPRPGGRMWRTLRGSVTHALLSRCPVSILAVKLPDA